jgi:hypothetical protein
MRSNVIELSRIAQLQLESCIRPIVAIEKKPKVKTQLAPLKGLKM